LGGKNKSMRWKDPVNGLQKTEKGMQSGEEGELRLRGGGKKVSKFDSRTLPGLRGKKRKKPQKRYGKEKKGVRD